MGSYDDEFTGPWDHMVMAIEGPYDGGDDDGDGVIG